MRQAPPNDGVLNATSKATATGKIDGMKGNLTDIAAWTGM